MPGTGHDIFHVIAAEEAPFLAIRLDTASSGVNGLESSGQTLYRFHTDIAGESALTNTVSLL